MARVFADQSNFYMHENAYDDVLRAEGVDTKIALCVSMVND